ncbi:MAG TPA: sterol-binding protein [Gammaproteobacteria bacterium]|nr:sterol-binding protein [Gammaproteobacteria bacterium]
MRLPDPAVILMEVAINNALKLDDFSFKKIQALQGKIIGIELTGINIRYYLAPTVDGVQVLSRLRAGQEADTWIRGTPLSMLKTALSDDRSSLFQGDVTIDGDMALGQQVQRILDGLEIDWEEPLSHVVGDIAAHQLGDIVRGFSGWAIKSLDSLTRSTGEYFQEETQDVVNSTELVRFIDQVDELRADTDRLQQRLEKINDYTHHE